MGNEIKEEQNIVKLTGGGEAGQNNRQGGRRVRNRQNNAATGRGTPGNSNSNKFTTRNKEFPENSVFDDTGQNDAANFQQSLKGIVNYLHTTYSAEVSDVILKMQEVVINVKEEPTLQKDPVTNKDIPLTTREEYKWKKTYNEQNAKQKVYDDSMPKAYIHIYNQ